MLRIIVVVYAALLGCGCIDRHRSVTAQMDWRCEGVVSMPERNLSRVEIASFRFVDNPRYYERVSGPGLCADLQALGAPTVSATFDVWGNTIFGLRGYNLTGLAAGSTPMKFYKGESGGYVDPGPHCGNFSDVDDRKQHPELYRFPLEVFR